MTRHSDIDQLAINTIRMLAIDAVQKANSGHPGTPMDAAPTAYVLWQRFLRYDPADPHWLDLLATKNIRARVVSMPSWELFDAQDPAYQQSVLPPAVTARVTAEEASPIGWGRYAGHAAWSSECAASACRRR
jgi:transketolase